MMSYAVVDGLDWVQADTGVTAQATDMSCQQ